MCRVTYLMLFSFCYRNELDASNPGHQQFAHSLVAELLQEIESKLKHEDDFLMRARLEEAFTHFSNHYCNDPMALVAIIRTCLNTELNLVQQQEMLMNGGPPAVVASPPPPTIPAVNNSTEIIDQLASLSERTTESASELRFLEQEQESLIISYNDCTKVNAQLAHLSGQQPITPQMQEMIKNLERQKQSGEQELKVKVTGLVQRRIALVEKLNETLDRLTSLQQRVLDVELINWKREQQMAGNGRPFDENRLNTIQEWCEQLAEIIWQNRHQIKECERHCTRLPLQAPGGVDMLPRLNQHITRQLSSLVTR